MPDEQPQPPIQATEPRHPYQGPDALTVADTAAWFEAQRRNPHSRMVEPARPKPSP